MGIAHERVRVGTVVHVLSCGRIGRVIQIRNWRSRVQLTKVVAKWFSIGDLQEASLLEKLAGAAR